MCWHPPLMLITFCRKRQVLQWVFAAAPGHPVLRELCDRIASTSAGSFSNNLNIDTLERTGPGVWTDVVLKHARARPPSKVCLDYLPVEAFCSQGAMYGVTQLSRAMIHLTT